MISSNDPADSIFIHCLKQILERFLFLGFGSIHYYVFVLCNIKFFTNDGLPSHEL